MALSVRPLLQIMTDSNSPGSAPRSAEEFRNALARHAGVPVHVVFTRNRVLMASVKFPPAGAPRLRISHLFLSAPDRVLEALGRYLASRDAHLWAVVRAFAKSTPPPSPGFSKPSRLPTRGRCYDLAAIRDHISRLYFNGELSPDIGWSRGGRRRHAVRRVIRYGTYNAALNLIRINPLLDSPQVPREFLEYIVFHEMLHAAVPSSSTLRRWRHHHGAFRVLERRYPDYDRMRQMGRDLVSRLR